MMKGRLIRAAPEWLLARRRGSGTAHNITSGKERFLDAKTMPPIDSMSFVSTTTTTTTTTTATDGASATIAPGPREESPTGVAHRALLFTLAAAQNALAGGLVYGWPALSGLLTADTDDGRGCGLTIAATTTLFAAASCVGMVSTLLLGYILDRAGPRCCSVVSHAIILLGCVVFASGTSFAVGIGAIAFGGPGVIVSSVHVANLFPSRRRHSAMSILNGAVAVSMSVFAAFALVWERYPAITYQHLFGGLGLLVGMSLVAGVLAWPDRAYRPSMADDHNEDIVVTDTTTLVDDRFDRYNRRQSRPTATDDYVDAATAHQQHSLIAIEQPLDSYLRDEKQFPNLTRHNSYLVSKKALESGLPSAVSLKDAPFYAQLTSGYFVRANVFFVVLCFWANFYVGTLAVELADVNTLTVAGQFQLLRLFGAVQGGCGVVASFAIGLVMDRSGVEVASAWTIALAVAHQLVVVLAVVVGGGGNNSDATAGRYLMLSGFVVYVFYRSFLFPVSVVLITSRLGFKYFGLLNGVGPIVLGALQLAMVPIVRAVQGTCHDYDSKDVELSDDTCRHGRWVELHVFEAFVLTVLFLVPVCDRRENTRARQRLQKMALMRSSWRMLYRGDGAVATSPLLLGAGRSFATATGYQDTCHPYGSMSAAGNGSLENHHRFAADDGDVLEF